MTEQTRRATRLLQIARLLEQYPQGLTVAEIAEKLEFSKRTIQRDINALESEIRTPIQVVGRRYKIDPDTTPLPPIRLNLQEARALLLAARLLARHSDEADPDTSNALHKLAEALPPGPVSREVSDTADAIGDRPVNAEQVRILRAITRCWASSTTVAIRYRSQRAQAELTTAFDPYLVEPAPFGAGTYVIGYSHKHREVRTFKLDRIVAASPSNERFVPRDIGEIKERLARSWGVVFDGEEDYDITVDFTPRVAQRVAETNWHASQTLTPLPDGSVRLQVRLPSLLEFIPWVRSWGPEAQVIAPDELRHEVAGSLREAAKRYTPADAGE
jgi:predicted DNA-binding transcriptional regulator YafY